MEETLLALAMILSWIGAFGPYRWGFGYDSFVHFTATLITAVMISAFVYALSPAARKNNTALIVIVLIVAMFAGVVNEMFEKYGDLLWGTMMYGEVGQPFDTAIDYTYDFAGAIVGIVAALTFKKKIIKFIK